MRAPTLLLLVARCGLMGGVDVSSPRVGIVGGGIGGLAAARALQLGGFNVTVFERDTSFDFRHQGYAVTIQQASLALGRLGLLEEVQAEDNACASHYTFDRGGNIITCFGRALHSANASSAGGRRNWHLPRSRLREILFRSLHPGTVKWGYRLKTIRQGVRETVQLGFDEGRGSTNRQEENLQFKEFDLAIGADGICMSCTNVHPVRAFIFQATSEVRGHVCRV